MTRQQSEYCKALRIAYGKSRSLPQHFTFYWSFDYQRKRGWGVQLYSQGRVPLGEPTYYHHSDPDGIPTHRIKEHLDLALKLYQLL